MSAQQPPPGPPQRPDAADSPWRTLAAREAYRNAWLSITEYQVLRPDGAPGIYGVVNPGDNVTIVALDEDQQVWVVEDFLYTIQRWSWFLPSGAIDPEEDALHAGRRELLEETGLRAARWDLLGACYLSPGISTQRSYLYLARELTEGQPQREPAEARMTAHRLPLREALTASRTSETASAVTMLGLMLAQEVIQAEAE